MPFNARANFKKVILPNNLEIFCLQKEEAFLIYDQIQEYFRNGIELREGDTVFDVGANIGIFSLWVNKLGAGNINIYAFEPIPKIFQVLEQNIQHCKSEKLKALPYGLSQCSKTQLLSYYPNLTAISTAYPDGSRKERDKLKKAAIQKIASLQNNSDSASPLYWYTRIPKFVLSFVIDIKLKQAFSLKQVDCQLKTLSEVIRGYKIQQIDLLKIDVEKSELDILLGIENEDWSKIKQIVLEVHDLNHRVDKIMLLLKNKGFSEVIATQEQYLTGTDIYNMYALHNQLFCRRQKF